ncbi:chaplin [Streptomyces jumonjinensis]|uniref:chaplin n=1 Tax=Streptomyces jumonjinensis TaxID=1945 RepID=UPI0037AD0C5D
MRQVTRKGLITMAAAGGALALGGGYAHAGAEALGGASNSPGVASGNSVQVPVSVPVNACGNSVNLVGLLNPAFGNNCANVSGSATPVNPGGSQPGGPSGGDQVGVAQTGGGAQAVSTAGNSPGVASGNNAQVPVDVPVNACGNSVDVVGLLNPVFGNDCVNASGPGNPVEPVNPGNPGEPSNPGNPGEPSNPGKPGDPGPGTPVEKPKPPVSTTPAKPNTPVAHTAEQPKPGVQLAQTGAESLGLIIPVGAGMVLAGAVLYRRARVRA